MKTCNKCKDEFPKTFEYFRKHKGYTYYQCRCCERKEQSKRKKEKAKEKRDLRVSLQVTNCIKCNVLLIDKNIFSVKSLKCKHCRGGFKWCKLLNTSPETIVNNKRISRSIRNKKERESLTDYYLKSKIQSNIKKSDNIKICFSEIPTELIEIKKKQLSLKREICQIN